MAGYRDTSSFDPNAGADDGPPLRPYNKWQRIGVAMMVVGTLAIVAAVAIRLASHQPIRHDWIPLGSVLAILGSVLISRRQPGGLSPEVKRQRLVIIAIAVAVMVLAAIVAILLSKGA